MSLRIIIFLLFFLVGCGGSSSNNENGSDEVLLTINVTNFPSDIKSYKPVNISITANYNCSFILESDDIYWISTNDNKNFSYRAPITLLNQEEFDVQISSIQTASCPQGSLTLTHTVTRDEDNLKYVPSPPPYNHSTLQTDYFASHNLGFGGIELSDRFSATICYPTPNDCQVFENALFGQDAHNMATGDFNGDGFEDIVVAWALFPHTIEPDQKVDAPINIYLNDGNGNLYEDNSIYYSGEAPTHPFAYRLAIADFNNDGIDDIFGGSMGLQYRDPDYANNFILPYPDLLLLSDSSGRFNDASANIDDQNDGNGKICGFSHDASTGDFDNDGDYDVFACNLLLVNDGFGNFVIQEDLDFTLQQAYGNPMSSLMVDLNNDNYDDLVFWNFDNRPNTMPEEGFVLISNGTAEIGNWTLIELPEGPFGRNHNKFNHAAWGDLNNDGNNDVIVGITRDLPYYEGAYVQVLVGDGTGNLVDVTNTNFNDQARQATHHGESNIYLRDFDNDGDLDIFHSTRDFASNLHGSHIALNDGNAYFTTIPESRLPQKPKANEWDNNSYLFKGMPINLDNQGCLDLIATSDSWMDDTATRNYLYSLINLKCE
tara:strand:+ start:18832 stop:20634 length:1803 start_codon:yes stop_codon:yes gene_type:complete